MKKTNAVCRSLVRFMRYNSLCSYGRSTPDRSRTVLISLGLRRCSSGYASSSLRRQHQHPKGNLYWLLMAAKNGIVLPCAVRSQTPLGGRNGVNASISPRRPGWQVVHLHRRKKKPSWEFCIKERHYPPSFISSLRDTIMNVMTVNFLWILGQYDVGIGCMVWRN